MPSAPSNPSAPPPSPEATWRLKRFFTSLDTPLDNFPQALTLTDETVVHHLRTVCRARPGEQVILVDDQREMAYRCTLTALEKNHIQLTADALLDEEPARLPYVTLAASLIKEQRWDWLVQKATELGVRSIQPLLSDHSVIRLSAEDFPKKLSRWHEIARNAAEQSDGLFIPQILNPQSVSAFCQGHGGNFRILLSERGGERMALKSLLGTVAPGQSMIVAVGPEGGWSDPEMDTWHAAGFVPAHLGSRVLRSETAAMAALSALNYEFSDDEV